MARLSGAGGVFLSLIKRRSKALCFNFFILTAVLYLKPKWLHNSGLETSSNQGPGDVLFQQLVVLNSFDMQNKNLVLHLEVKGRCNKCPMSLMA